MEFPNYEKINNLKQLIHNSLTPLINNDYVLLDVPNHRNIGDNLIWKGEKEFLKTIPFKEKYSCNHYTFEKKYISEKDVILMHGGGNFGDIYPSAQNFRLKVLELFPNNKIIFLPQTIFFKNKEILKTQSIKLKEHKNLYICVRDKKSQKLLSEFGIVDNVLLLPDMAFCLDLRNFIDENKKNKSLYLKRTDSEFNTELDEGKILNFLGRDKIIDIKDWPSYSNNLKINRWLVRRDVYKSKLSKLLIKIPLIKRAINPEYGMNSKGNLEKYIISGITFINGYDNICTTRLHGFILSILLNKEVAIVDNSYGKNKEYFDTWLSDFEKIKFIK
ncbi:polysaccharide pyruvyl transferase family protein [Tenacibaculum sp.]|uniref:polysaccharide pyruvyl transferase family protein n=1 Tax=Tenacibaculum sp. TaxID=1906242 RepID=UPI003AA8137E